MANKMLVSLIGVLVSLSSIVMICDAGNLYTVGDEKGWTLGVDYEAWALHDCVNHVIVYYRVHVCEGCSQRTGGEWLVIR